MRLRNIQYMGYEDTQPLVSIIIPTYNQESFLDRALSDACEQSYRNIEIIVVNDGSTDSSQEIAETWTHLDNRIRIVKKDNGGLVSANVSGLRHARGQYICFFDPDDRIGSSFVELLLQEMSEEIDFVAASFSYQYTEQCVKFPLAGETIYSSNELKKLSNNYILDSNCALDNKIFVARWNKIYRKSCLDKFLDIYESCSSVALGEDSLFTFLLLQYAKGGKAITSDCTYRYVQHSKSMMHSLDWKSILAQCDKTFECFSRICKQFLQEDTPASILYYALVSGALSTAADNSLKAGIEMYRFLMSSKRYRKALASVSRTNSRNSFNLFLQCAHCPASIYVTLRRIRKELSSGI